MNRSDFSTWAVTWQNQQNECAPRKNSDQPGHPPSLIRVFSVSMKKTGVLSYPLSARRRLWSDWADAQADLSLRWAHTHCVGFVMSRLIFTAPVRLPPHHSEYGCGDVLNPQNHLRHPQSGPSRSSGSTNPHHIKPQLPHNLHIQDIQWLCEGSRTSVRTLECQHSKLSMFMRTG